MSETPKEIPARHECPQRFCFHWCPAGTKVEAVPRLYGSLQEALNEATWIVVDEARCGLRSEACRRSGRPGATADWYEPCEPELDKAGLPHGYFCGS